MSSFHLISLGCAKNLVDSEVMLGSMTAAGWQLTEDPEAADVLILNTCGFIQSAVEEAIAEILELVKIKEAHPERHIVVVGCLVQRYKENLSEELPEVDLFLGTEGAADIAGIIDDLVNGKQKSRVMLPDRFLMTSETPRVISTPPFRAWLKITEGCDNRCSYCMIPTIRGSLRSRSIKDLITEAQTLAKGGVKELSLIAQDITAYGRDRGDNSSLEDLLGRLLSETTIPWLRLLYLYPTGVSDALLNLMAENRRIVPYLDIPMQHVNDKMLRLMNRRYTAESLYRLVEKVRSIVPDIALRTTFLVGFPGETEQDFLEIESFLQKTRIDHVGVFPYANEEGAPSESFAGQLPDPEKVRRQEHLLAVQRELSMEIQKKYIGRVEPVLIEGLSSETDLLLEGRTRYQAPEVDGCTYINDGVASPGDIVAVRITETQVYDVIGEIVGEGRLEASFPEGSAKAVK
ncbi:MAG TPA: 30S ribosomal protein S12 methylthiotransferase RimO [Desulfobulbaceae bacterium]|nr:30S ribosomal protein S12 methylthiotransferase RimO [Desulfobulbaceae bacterium]